MNESAENSPDREARLDRLIAHCYQAMEDGDGLNQDAIIKANPEFAEELREFFSDVGVMEQWGPGDASQQTNELLVAASPFDSSLDKDAQPSSRISQYEVIEQIGSRPLGVVLKARHVNLRRIVALKLLRHGEWASPREINRLKIEARTTTNLNHPGIVSVHEFGLHRGRHFVVMDYIDGGSLSQRIAQGPLTPTRSAQLLFQIASAVQAAHEAGVIHRDLKPSNILLSKDGTPRVTDFGFTSRRLGCSDSAFGSPHRVGPIGEAVCYMAPEQASKKQSTDFGPAVDVYALGALLYALLTGRAPFVSDSRLEVIDQLLHRDPVSPRKINPQVPPDLETICMRCLQKRPKDRYATAKEVAQDLTRFLQSRPIETRPVSRIKRLVRSCQRNRFRSAVALLTLSIAIVGALGLYSLSKDPKNREAARAAVSRWFGNETETSEAPSSQSHSSETSEGSGTQASVDVDSPERTGVASTAGVSWEDRFKTEATGDTTETVVALPTSEEEEATPRSFEWLYWNRLAIDALPVIETPDIYHDAIALNATCSRIATGGTDGVVRIWDRAAGVVILELEGHNDSIMAVEFSPDGRWLATAGGDEKIIIWDVAKQSELRTLVGHRGSVTSLAFSPDGTLLASASDDGTARLWNPATGRILQLLSEKQGGEVAGGHVAFSGDGQILAHAKDGLFEVWHVAPPGRSPRCVRRFQQPLGFPCSDLDCNHDGSLVILGGAEANSTCICSVVNGALFPFRGAAGVVSAVSFSADGSRVVVGYQTGQIKIWNTTDAKLLGTVREHESHVQDIVFGQDNKTVVSVSMDDDSISAFDRVVEFPVELEIEGEPRSGASDEVAPTITDATWCGVRDSILARSSEGVMSIWALDRLDARNPFRPLFHSFPGDNMYHEAFTVSPDGKHMVCGVHESQDTLLVIDFQSRRTKHEMKAGAWEVKAVAFRNDSMCFAMSSSDGTCEIWNARTGEMISTMDVTGEVIERLAFSRDGAVLGGLCEDGALRFWRTSDGSLIQTLEGRGSAVDISFSPTQDVVACGFEAATLLLDLTSLETRNIGTHLSSLQALTFSPDGTRLLQAFASPDLMANSSIQVLDTESYAEILAFDGNPSRITRLSFNSTGQALLAVTHQGKILVWDCRLRAPEPDPTSVLAGDASPESSARTDSRDVATRLEPPQLLLPLEGAMLGNRRNGSEKETWLFDWKDVPEATRYHLYVKSDLASEPLIDNDRLAESEFVHEQRQVIAPNHRRGWTWKVRAWIEDRWTPWSEEKHFDISAGVPIPNGPPGVPNAGTETP